MSIKARLGDYIQEYSVRNRADEDIPVYSVTNTQGFCRDYFGKEVASKDKSTYKIVPKGCFAYNPSRINVGSVDWQRYEDRVIVSPLYNVFSVAPQLDQQYLYYFLKSDYALQRIRAVATGSVRDNLKLAMLYEFPINLPSTEVQKEIVKKLDGVKRVISLREQELQTLDDLIKARFVEMSSAWNCVEKPLFEYLDSITYGFTNPMPDAEEGPWKITAKDVVNGHVNFETARKTTKEAFDELTDKSKPNIGDVLLTKDGTLGRTAIVENENICVNQSVAVLRCNDKVVPRFLSLLLQLPEYQREMSKNSGGGTIKHIYITKVDKMLVMIPSINQQKEFIKFVEQVDKSKVVAQKALDEAKLLFDSLMQRYFG